MSHYGDVAHRNKGQGDHDLVTELDILVEDELSSIICGA